MPDAPWGEDPASEPAPGVPDAVPGSPAAPGSPVVPGSPAAPGSPGEPGGPAGSEPVGSEPVHLPGAAAEHAAEAGSEPGLAPGAAAEHGVPAPDDAAGAADFTAPRRGEPRRNALDATSWVALTEVDARVADALLESLEDAGVAAYAQPVTGARGPYLDTRLPPSPTERIFVDSARREIGESVVAAELPGLLDDLAGGALDEESMFAAIVAAWDKEADTPVPPWPAEEDVEAAQPARAKPKPRPKWTVDEDEDDEEPAAVDDGHRFVPPPPPPIPPVSPVTRWAASAVAFGLFLILGLPLFATEPSQGALVFGVLLVIGGIVTLVARMRDAPSVDDGPDDGAVV